ncbi:hypothetical protein [Arthrobacter sp. UYCu712]|uniref:hypothetical protein n=1 Tax=Arthrobacter sp. UYCu712 TaxID=3156340 RepID=UPI003398EB90
MRDPLTLSFTLTYAATLGVGLLMFLGQVLTVTALLVIAGTTSALAWAVRRLSRLITRTPARR